MLQRSEIKKLVQKAQLDTELQSTNEYREKVPSWRFRAKRKVKELNKKETHNETVSKKESSLKETININIPLT